MKNRVELRGYIRYQLMQLSARNGEHEFELLSFELARLRHVSNLQPATGPVKAGGDQGRDFESYKTYLVGSALARSTFLTLASSDLVVGACTLDKQTPTKIRRDLKVIFGSGNRPDHVLYFCEQDVPVAKRHELQADCMASYGAALDIFGGQAIADQLADPDTFWIAEQYLSVPGEFYPKEEIDEAYEERRGRWLQRSTPAVNYADFLDIKMGLRTAVNEESAKPDLAGWISRMREFTEENISSRLRQKARYEISVAELRGHSNLDPAQPYVDAFFYELGAAPRVPSDVLDAAVLAIYCWGAFLNHHATISLDTVRLYIDKVADLIEASLSETNRRGDLCTLLESRALLAAFPRQGQTRDAVLQQSVDAWRDVVKAVQNLPSFPIAHIADLVEIFAPLAGQHETFRTLRDEIDRLSDERAGAHEVADRSFRRALSHLEAGNRLAAIDELQRAKVGSFTGDEMPNSVLAMLQLSECYANLGLHVAARYYAAGATYVALHTENERVHRLLSKAGFALLQTFYGAGEGTTFMLGLQQIIGMHLSVARDPLNFAKHPDLQRALVHAAIFIAIAHRLAPHLDDTISTAVASWPLDKDEVNGLMAMASSPGSPWSTMSASEIEAAIERDLGRSPFSDIGDPREISWSALGIRWTVCHSADKATTLAALELVATLQIAQVELADVELLVIPTDALIIVETGSSARPDLKPLANNHRLTWKAVLPAERPGTEELNACFAENIAVVAAVIGQATALDYEAFRTVITQSLERGLAHRVFSVRPARELMEFARANAEGVEDLKALRPVTLSRSVKPQEPPELAWRSGTGPGYSHEKAPEFLANRYRRTSEIIRFSLPRLLADERIRALLLDLKRRDFLDWQILSILASIVGQYQVEAKAGRRIGPGIERLLDERMSRAERADDPLFDLSLIDEQRLARQAAVLSAATFRTWGLALNRQTPDTIGIKRLLDERYRHSTDDIPHADLFP